MPAIHLPYKILFASGKPPLDAHLNPFSSPSLSVTVSSLSVLIYRGNDGLMMEMVGFTINTSLMNLISVTADCVMGRTTPGVLRQ